MKDVYTIECKNCGEKLELSMAINNIIKCKYCNTENIFPKDDTSEEAKLYLHDGQRALDLGNFDEAFTCFDKASEIDSKEPEGYFGKFLAKHKVQYLKDVVNNRLQPIVHELIDNNIFEDKNYKNACRFANPYQKEIYQKRAKEIEDIKKSFMELDKSNLDYDCFICVKVTDDETKTKTKDYKIADDIYFALRGKGYKPFFSEREIGSKTGSDYEAMILYALMKSECMLVVCSNEDYLNTKWVKNEYTRFLKLVNDEVKSSDAITIVFNGKPIEKLPGKKGKIQGINISSLGAMENIENYVCNHISKAKKDKPKFWLSKVKLVITLMLISLFIGGGALVTKDILSKKNDQPDISDFPYSDIASSDYVSSDYISSNYVSSDYVSSIYVSSDYAGGNGTKEHPYLIENETHLKNINKNLDSYFKLVNDIEITDSRWQPIGTNKCKGNQDANKLTDLIEASAFSGCLDGNNKKITYDLNTDKQITEDGNDYAFGLFGLIRNAKINDLNIDAKVYCTDITRGNSNVAGLIAGWAIDSEFVRCTTYGKVSLNHGGGSNKGCIRSGGFVGIAKNCYFDTCTNNADVLAGCFYASSGGIAGGNANSRYNNCYNNGKIESNHGSWIFGADNHGDLYGTI